MLPESALSSSQSSLALQPEVAHILFLDIVAYSSLPMQAQTAAMRELQTLVRGSHEFQRAQASETLLSRPTGDGVALVFFDELLTPLRCAIEIANALRSRPHIRIRTGIHSGLIYVVEDINGHADASGDGMVTAQRVMDCGDAGHILLSRSFAEQIDSDSPWAKYLHDIGNSPIKHCKQQALVNFYSTEWGNPRRPRRMRDSLAQQRLQPILRTGKKTLRLASVLGIAAIIAWYGWPLLRRGLNAVIAAHAAASEPPHPVHSIAPVPRHSSHRRPSRVSGAARSAEGGSIEMVSANPPELEADETAETSTPPVSGNSEHFAYTLRIGQDGRGTRQVRVVYHDALGWHDANPVADQSGAEGETIPLHFDYRGHNTTLRVYYNSQLVRQQRFASYSSE